MVANVLGGERMTSISSREYKESTRNVNSIIALGNGVLPAEIIATYKGSYFKHMFEQIIEHTREESEKKELFIRGLESLSSEAESLSSIIEDISSNNEVIHDISALKKRIKHCKNPLERKQLEKELNLAYKEKKKNGKL